LAIKLSTINFKRNKFGYPVLGFFLLSLPLFANAFQLHIMISMCINIMMAVSMWILSTTGLISFGQAGFMFIGAMTSTLLVKNLGWPFWLCLPLAGIIPALVCIPIGRLCIRVKGVYFFLVTMAFGFLVNGVFAYFKNPFGGWYGILHIPPPEPHTLFTPLNKTPFYYLAAVLTLITCWVVYLISRSRVGMILRSIKESDILAEAIGIDVIKYKLQTFVVAAFFAGLAGVYYAHYYSYISPLVFSFNMSFNCLIFIIVGGPLHFLGPIVGAVVLTIIPEFFRATGVYQMLIYGIILIFSMIFIPRGIMGFVEERGFPLLAKWEK
jgi:branched-chain amino acid transport system permease protein